MPTNIHFSFTLEQRMVAKKLLQASELPWGGLPYTPEFDAMRQEFADLTGDLMPPPMFWRLLVRVAADGLGRRQFKPKGLD